jgi:hypothetical protein
MDGIRRDAPPTATPTGAGEADPLLTPPRGMTRDQRKFWTYYAPFALAQRTLVAEHLPGFRELCEQAAFKADIVKEMKRLKKNPEALSNSRRHYEKAVQRLDATLARFKLTGLGRPADPVGSARKSAPNPWAQAASSQ